MCTWCTILIHICCFSIDTGHNPHGARECIHVMSNHVFICKISAIFTIVPTTQYVWINQTVTFTCATNITGYSLTISHFGPNHIPLYISIHSILLPEGGKYIAGSFIASQMVNGTGVICVAHAENESTLQFTLPAYTYTQGRFIFAMHTLM